jgi:hypothetical protein
VPKKATTSSLARTVSVFRSISDLHHSGPSIGSLRIIQDWGMNRGLNLGIHDIR